MTFLGFSRLRAHVVLDRAGLEPLSTCKRCKKGLRPSLNLGAVTLHRS